MSVNSRDHCGEKHVNIAAHKKLPHYFWQLAASIHLTWLILLQPLVFLIQIPLHFRWAWKRLCNEYLVYKIEDPITSPASKLFFTRSKSIDENICLKVWQRRKYGNGNQHPEDKQRDIDNLLDGWNFNRRFAPDIYLGVASIKELSEEAMSVQRGRLIFLPTKSSLKPDTEYVLVMRRLPEDQRLDKQLDKETSCEIEKRMDFLAKEVAHMHNRLKKSPEDMGMYESIASKLFLNADLFEKALDRLASMNMDEGIHAYRTIMHLLKKACNEYEHFFHERYNSGHIRRCHGDLKTTNLWIRPKKALWRFKQPAEQLVPLDCVDFRPDFCHIDTLSDIAMLAIDIEARLLHEYKDEKRALAISTLLLNSYLRKVQANSERSWPLLEYYMVEKAIVCAYVSILFDNIPDMGKEYLKVALSHANRLMNLPGAVKKVLVSEEEAEAVHSYSN